MKTTATTKSGTKRRKFLLQMKTMTPTPTTLLKLKTHSTLPKLKTHPISKELTLNGQKFQVKQRTKPQKKMLKKQSPCVGIKLKTPVLPFLPEILRKL